MVLRHKTDVDFDEFEAYIQQPNNADRLLELIDGEIIEKVPTQEHGLIVGNIFVPLRTFVRQNNLGRVTTEVLYRLPPDPRNGVLPDISFTSDLTSPVVREGAVPVMPDLAIEIQSPSQSDTFMVRKASYYLAHGSKLVWLVFPSRRIVEVHRRSHKVETFTEEGTLDGGEVLPGFRLNVSEVFRFD